MESQSVNWIFKEVKNDTNAPPGSDVGLAEGSDVRANVSIGLGYDVSFNVGFTTGVNDGLNVVFLFIELLSSSKDKLLDYK